METGGGELLDGFVDVGEPPKTPESVSLRRVQLDRVLGIEIPFDKAGEILEGLGLKIESQDADIIKCVPPTWRKDLTREVDLIEEVGRIFGFDKVPDDAPVPICLLYTSPSPRDRQKSRMPSSA